MIHQYKAKGYNIVLDVYSGSVHLVDEISYDIISLLNKNIEKEKIEEEIMGLHKINKDQFDEAYEEVKNLVSEKVLFSEDDFKDLTIDLDKRKTYLKAMCLNVSHTCNLYCQYCFAKEGRYHGPEAIMTDEVSKKAIDFLLENSGSHYNLDIDFFGGEPLLNWDLVKNTVAYARSKEKEFNKLIKDENYQIIIKEKNKNE